MTLSDETGEPKSAFAGQEIDRDGEGWLDRKLEGIGQSLADPVSRRDWKKRLLRRMRKLLLWVSLIYIAATFFGLVVSGWIGERNLTTVFVLYVPPLTWLIPAVPLAFAALVMLSWRTITLLVIWTVFYLVWYMDFGFLRGGEKAEAGDFELTVLTHNSGQRGGSLRPFKNQWKPDVLATQEGSRAKRYLAAPGYQEFPHGKNEREFMVLSKFPIMDSGLVLGRFEEDEKAIAAWFELDIGEGRPLVIYNVHLPSPRDTLRANMWGGALYGILGIPGTPWAEERRAREKFWDKQIAYAEQLLAELKAEERAFLVVGDFNAPAKGLIYRMFASSLQDAHSVAGKGYGYTFPGITRNPLSFFGPWMRLDFLFAGPGWKVHYCETEARGRPSQHLSAIARFARAKDSF